MTRQTAKAWMLEEPLTALCLKISNTRPTIKVVIITAVLTRYARNTMFNLDYPVVSEFMEQININLLECTLQD
jgi:hypothetical protein